MVESDGVADAGTIEATPDQPEDIGTGVAPVVAPRRIASIDVLRGLALLGILVMNIPFFALSAFAFFNPDEFGGFEGPDYATWLGSHLLFDMKMMTLFSLLFGAGLVLFAEKAVSKSGRAAGLHYRRMAWLLVIGLIHAYLIWEGDILVWYALCGMLIYPLRFLRARWLLVIGLAMMLVTPVINTGQGFMFQYMRDQAERMEAGETLSEMQEGFATAWIGERDEETGEVTTEGVTEGFSPEAEQIEEEREAVLGAYTDRVRYRAEGVFFMQTYLFLVYAIWRVCGTMIVGMALFKWGVLGAGRSWRMYATMAALGFGLGLPLVGAGVGPMHRVGFDPIELFKFVWHFNYFGSLLVAMGWMGVVMLVCKAGALAPVRAGLAAVGRMAFTNYLMQSLICGAIFFGWGLGYFGSLSRSELVPIVLGVWAFQIGFSLLWLRAFRFGPMEWLWRSLTYWKPQPMRRADRA